MVDLAKPQLKVLSNFFYDVAKGLFLGSVANQFVSSSSSPGFKLFISCFGVLSAFMMLFFALEFSKPKNKINYDDRRTI